MLSVFCHASFFQLFEADLADLDLQLLLFVANVPDGNVDQR